MGKLIMKSVIYWSPHLSDVATAGNVINSAISLKKYSKVFEPSILDACGEWKRYSKKIYDNDIKYIKLSKLDFNKYFPFQGFFKSRVISIVVILFNLIPLLKYLKKEKPDFLIVHLLSSLPLLLLLIFNFKTKMILRISGLPKLNFFRSLLWKLIKKKITFVSCPSEETKNNLIEKKIFDYKKTILLYDPIINIKKINKEKKEELIQDNLNKEDFLCIGRLTKQKNHILLIKLVNHLRKKNINIRINVLGSGENENKLKSILKEKKLDKNIFLLGYKKNVFPYIKSCKAVIIPSLWEDPGAVMVEASYMRKIIICSDCPSGPKEFIDNNKRGYIFKNDDYQSLAKTIEIFSNDDDLVKLSKVKEALLKSRDYSIFNHFKKLELALKKN